MSNDKLAEALRTIAEWNPPPMNDRDGNESSMALEIGSNGVRDYFRGIARNALQAHAAEAAQTTYFLDCSMSDKIELSLRDAGFPLDEASALSEKLTAQPQDAKDAAIPLKGWIFDKVDMGRGDERYICTRDGSNATTVRNETTSDHRERLLWLIADAMAKESGR